MADRERKDDGHLLRALRVMIRSSKQEGKGK